MRKKDVMQELPPLPRSELQVAQIVWRLGEATVRDVVDALPDDRELDFWTVQTYLRRLAQKGFLEVQKKGRSNVYSAAVEPQRVIGEVFRDTIDRLFNGEAIPVFQHLIEDRGLSDEEIEQLQTVLNELKVNRTRKSRKKK